MKAQWFSVPDSRGRSRAGVLAVLVWKGPWPISTLEAEELLTDRGELEALRLRIRHPGRLSQSVLARLLLQLVRVGGGPACTEMSFSIAHSAQTAVVLGFEDDCCGVDLEVAARSHRNERATRRFLDSRERGMLERVGLSPWSAWCAKESLGKALGTGLQAPLSQYALARVSGGPIQGGAFEFSGFPTLAASSWDLAGGSSLAICLPQWSPSRHPLGIRVPGVS
jgi:hypothetical protein